MYERPGKGKRKNKEEDHVKFHIIEAQVSFNIVIFRPRYFEVFYRKLKSASRSQQLSNFIIPPLYAETIALLVSYNSHGRQIFFLVLSNLQTTCKTSVLKFPNYRRKRFSTILIRETYILRVLRISFIGGKFVGKRRKKRVFS